MLANNISTNTQTLPVLLNVSNTVLHVSASEFDSLCLDNPDLRLELTKDQELIEYWEDRQVKQGKSRWAKGRNVESSDKTLHFCLK